MMAGMVWQSVRWRPWFGKHLASVAEFSEKGRAMDGNDEYEAAPAPRRSSIQETVVPIFLMATFIGVAFCLLQGDMKLADVVKTGLIYGCAVTAIVFCLFQCFTSRQNTR